MRRVGDFFRVSGSILLLALAAYASLASIVNGHYDPQQNRAPAARIVVAAVALIPALAALRFALPAADAQHPRRRIATWTGMAFLSLLFLLAWLVIWLSSGAT